MKMAWLSVACCLQTEVLGFLTKGLQGSLSMRYKTQRDREVYNTKHLRTTSKVNGKLTGEYDIAVVGAGIGGLCCAAVLTQCYGKRVAVLESHYLAGGCAHAFEKRAPRNLNDSSKSFVFDSGPTIVLGCSQPPFNPLRQVLDAVDAQVDWIRYDGWGMVVPEAECPKEVAEIATKRDRAEGAKAEPGKWRLTLGPGNFEDGPLKAFGGKLALEEFQGLREITKPLVAAAVDIPAMAMRGGTFSLLPLLRHWDALVTLAQQGDTATGPFRPFMDGPLFKVTDPWLRSWLDALAFSLSGLPAADTSAAAMAYVLFDLHREGAALDYPKGGMGAVIDALVDTIEAGGSTVSLSTPVASIDLDPETGSRAVGVTLASASSRLQPERLRTKGGVVCNAPVWSLGPLLRGETQRVPGASGGAGGSREDKKHVVLSEAMEEFLEDKEHVEMTKSYLHLHLALDATGLDMSSLEAHYTVMDQGLLGDSSFVCGDQNMVAVSNPCKLDPTLAPPGYVVLHAYCCGNEPYEAWEHSGAAATSVGSSDAEGHDAGAGPNSGNMADAYYSRYRPSAQQAPVPSSPSSLNEVKGGGDSQPQAPRQQRQQQQREEYASLKEKRAEVLWRAVESVIPDARERAVMALVGTPLTHERFLRRPRGTYGATFASVLPDVATPVAGLVLCGDSVFPGIGVPAVAVNGASAANTLVGPFEHWRKMDELSSRGVI